MARKSNAQRLADRLTTPIPRVKPTPADDFLSTGCTLLNMAFTGHPDRGIPKGGYLYLVGDSGASKTWMTFCAFAEASRNNHFNGYRFVFDNAENGAMMDVNRFFGSRVVERLEPPRLVDGEPAYSETVQEFYLNLETNCRQGPCVYVLDSMDALNDDADEQKFEAELKVFGGESTPVPGSMGMNKAKTNSRSINRVVKALRKNGSILVVISQTRDKVGSHIPGQKTRGGGRALRFYAHLEAWLSVRETIVRTYLRKPREIGAKIQIDVQKNRVNGWEGKVPLIPFIKGYGVDDVGSCVDYLLDERHWTGAKSGRPSVASDDNETGKTFTAPEFDFTGTREQLIQRIQDESDEWDLRQLVSQVWRDIVAGATPNRKPRYT